MSTAGIEAGIAVVFVAAAYVAAVVVTTKVMHRALPGLECEPQEQAAAKSAACHGAVVVISSEPRCAGCGHRQPDGGMSPRPTRTLPPWTWWPEIRDRRRAKLVGRWTGQEEVTA